LIIIAIQDCNLATPVNIIIFFRGGSRIFGKEGGQLEAAISWVEMYSQHAKHGGTSYRGSGGMSPQENFKNRY